MLLSTPGRNLFIVWKAVSSYLIGEDEYTLEAGDSLIFQAYIPHRWENRTGEICNALLIICPSDHRDRSVEQHLIQKDVEE